jgi:hypothetical protein
MKAMRKARAAVCCGALLLAAPSLAGIRTVQGQSFWTGDPGPVFPGNYFVSGQARFDPYNHLEEQAGYHAFHNRMVVFADHEEARRCVLRQRVLNTDWDQRHPYLLVCRP